MISQTHKFIFVHINKTGGTSIEKVFHPQADEDDVPNKHATAAFYQRAGPGTFRDYFKFSFVRNPWDWLVSRYHWSRDHQRLFDYSFGEFLWRLERGAGLSDRAPWLADALLPQVDRLMINGEVAMDFVGRFENLQGDFDRICSRLGVASSPLERVFKTQHRDYAEYYDTTSRNIVARCYAADIAAFGYRFDPGLDDHASKATRTWRGLTATFHGHWNRVTAVSTPIESTPGVIRVERLPDNPIIRPSMLPGRDGDNINGPSLIRVPDWIRDPLGKYYLYFAHHEGTYIRLAYADDLAGPWHIHVPGVLPIENTPCNDIRNPVVARKKHVASPDVHVDLAAREIRLYYHGYAYVSGPEDDELSYPQVSLLATSKDGLAFDAKPQRLGNPYFRVFEWDGAWYALGMPGSIYRSNDGVRRFAKGPALFAANLRHSALRICGSTLQVFHSRIGDNPERILVSDIELVEPWTQWKVKATRVVLSPERTWEGAALPAVPSMMGIAREPVRQLRDPAIFTDDGTTYLLYSVEGESGIAIAQLK